MAMRYFKNATNEVFGYDDALAAQNAIIQALDATWTEVTASWPVATSASHNAPLLAQIAVLEAGQARALRQVALGNGATSYTAANGTTTTALADLQAVETAIAALRAQLRG